MAKTKKNLKSALASHQLRGAEKLHQEKVQAAQERKVQSIKSGGAGKKKRSLDRKRRKGEEVLELACDARREEGADGMRQGGRIRAMSKGKGKSVDPFLPDDTILLVGEGDFSFTLSLLSAPHSHAPTRILSTSFDSEQTCLAKYPTASSNLSKIRSIFSSSFSSNQLLQPPDSSSQHMIRFGVDAGSLQSDKMIRKWGLGGFSKIWFGFPHVGMGYKDEARNILANQLLLLRFLVSAAPLLSTGQRPAYALLNEQGGVKGKKKRKADEEPEDEEEEEEEEEERADQEEEVVQEGRSDRGNTPEQQEIMEKDLVDVPLPHDSSTMTTTSKYPPPSPRRAGSLLITLREAKPYTLWQLSHLATRLTSMLPLVVASAPALPKGMKAPTLQDVLDRFPELANGSSNGSAAGGQAKRKDRGYDVWRSFQFHPREWQGYRHVRTIGAKEGGANLLESKEGDEEAPCRTWELGLRT